jgi:hypothetical protein
MLRQTLPADAPPEAALAIIMKALGAPDEAIMGATKRRHATVRAVLDRYRNVQEELAPQLAAVRAMMAQYLGDRAAICAQAMLEKVEQAIETGEIAPTLDNLERLAKIQEKFRKEQRDGLEDARQGTGARQGAYASGMAPSMRADLAAVDAAASQAGGVPSSRLLARAQALDGGAGGQADTGEDAAGADAGDGSDLSGDDPTGQGGEAYPVGTE